MTGDRFDNYQKIIPDLLMQFTDAAQCFLGHAQVRRYITQWYPFEYMGRSFHQVVV